MAEKEIGLAEKKKDIDNCCCPPEHSTFFLDDINDCRQPSAHISLNSLSASFANDFPFHFELNDDKKVIILRSTTMIFSPNKRKFPEKKIFPFLSLSLIRL